MARCLSALNKIEKRKVLPTAHDCRCLSALHLVRANHRHNVGWLFSPRFGAVEYGSTLSRDAIIVAHEDPQIRLMLSRPLEMTWPNAAHVIRRYYPHFGLLRNGELVIVDVVYDRHHGQDDLPDWLVEFAGSRPAFLDRAEALHDAFHRAGAKYEIWRASEIRAGSRVSNNRRMMSCAGLLPNPSEINRACAVMRRHPAGLRASDLAAALQADGNDLNHVLAMVFHGHLRLANPLEDITPASLLIENGT